MGGTQVDDWGNLGESVSVLSITKVRDDLTRLPERLEKKSKTVAVTRRGKPVLAILRWDLYEALIETLDVMGDPEFFFALQQSVEEMNAGDVIPWEAALKELEEDDL